MAISFMRRFIWSRWSIGTATVKTVAKTQNAARMVASNCGSMTVSTNSIIALLPSFRSCATTSQNLKLIIFFMTSTPIVIQTAAPRIMKCPMVVVKSGMMYSGDER